MSRIWQQRTFINAEGRKLDFTTRRGVVTTSEASFVYLLETMGFREC